MIVKNRLWCHCNRPRGNVRGPLAIWLHRWSWQGTGTGQYCGTILPWRHVYQNSNLDHGPYLDATFEWQAHLSPALVAGLIPMLLTHCRPTSIRILPRMRHWHTVHPWVKQARCIDELYERAILILGKDGTVDLVGILGYYAFSMTIKAFDVDPFPIEKGEH